MEIPLDNEKDVEQYWINLQASSQREKGISDAKAIAEATKSWVRIEGLQSTAGQALNGKVGQLITGKVNEGGRFAVKVDGEQSGKLLKGSNLVAVQKEELARTYLLPDHKTLFYPKMHSIFTECDPDGNSPALKLCGCPLIVKRLADGSSGDNQWATWLMIDPISGFAPQEWQRNVGKTLVYRPGGLDLDIDDMSSINEFLGDLLDRYSDGPGFDPGSWLNPDKFQRYIRASVSNSYGRQREFNILD